MQELMTLIKEERKLRAEVEDLFRESLGLFAIAEAQMPTDSIASITSFSSLSTNVEISTQQILNLKVPKFNVKIEGDLFDYGFASTVGDFDLAVTRMALAFEEFTKLSERASFADTVPRE